MLDNFPLCSSLALAGRIPREPSQRAPFYEPGSPGALRGLRALPGFFGRPAAKLGPVEAPKVVRHIAFGCSPCPKQCRTWPMFVASVDLFLPQSQGSIHQCCHDPNHGPAVEGTSQWVLNTNCIDLHATTMVVCIQFTGRQIESSQQQEWKQVKKKGGCSHDV